MKNGGTVYIRANNYDILSTIILRPNVSLELENGVVLALKSNVDVIRIAPRSKLSGGIIDVSGVRFSKSAILLDGSDKFGFCDNTIIEDVIIINKISNSRPNGKAIYFRCMDPISGYINGVHVKNIAIRGTFEYGIYFYRSNESSANWINANIFESIYGWGPKYFIFLDGKPRWAIDGNSFINIQYQSTVDSECVLTIGGFNNQFNCMIWDWRKNRGIHPIRFLPQSGRNYVVTDIDYILDEGSNNTVVII